MIQGTGLPAELWRAIATWCDAYSVRALHCTSRAIRACIASCCVYGWLGYPVLQLPTASRVNPAQVLQLARGSARPGRVCDTPPVTHPAAGGQPVVPEQTAYLLCMVGPGCQPGQADNAWKAIAGALPRKPLQVRVCLRAAAAGCHSSVLAELHQQAMLDDPSLSLGLGGPATPLTNEELRLLQALLHTIAKAPCGAIIGLDLLADMRLPAALPEQDAVLQDAVIAALRQHSTALKSFQLSGALWRPTALVSRLSDTVSVPQGFPVCKVLVLEQGPERWQRRVKEEQLVALLATAPQVQVVQLHLAIIQARRRTLPVDDREFPWTPSRYVAPAAPPRTHARAAPPPKPSHGLSLCSMPDWPCYSSLRRLSVETCALLSAWLVQQRNSSTPARGSTAGSPICASDPRFKAFSTSIAAQLWGAPQLQHLAITLGPALSRLLSISLARALHSEQASQALPRTWSSLTVHAGFAPACSDAQECIEPGWGYFTIGLVRKMDEAEWEAWADLRGQACSTLTITDACIPAHVDLHALSPKVALCRGMRAV